MGMHVASIVRQVRDVWAWSLQSEFLALLAALRAAGPGATVALDTEFPGALDEAAWKASSPDVRYNAMKASVDLLSPIQVGLALASADGRLLGAWTFNLLYDLRQDLHTDAAVNFLSAAGIDFPRHAAEGIDRQILGNLLARSPLVGAASPRWLTFSGLYDLGYLLKLLIPDPLPCNVSAFDDALAKFCPQNLELRDWLPHGSLERLAKDYGVSRQGQAHTAGSDALVTLKLFLLVSPPKSMCSTGEQPDVDPSAAFLDLLSAEEAGPPPPEPEFTAFSQVALPFCPSTRPCSAARWGVAARWAMQTAEGSCKAAKTAPGTLWGSAARDALGEATKPPWGSAARDALGETTKPAWGSAARDALGAATKPPWGSAARDTLGEARKPLWGSSARDALGEARKPLWGLAVRHALEATKQAPC